jgi:dolichol-phosphate mannosyltransferase
MKVWIVLPAYNEAANIPPLFKRFQEVESESQLLDINVILVDDGSTDGSAAIATASAGPLSVEVFRNETNRGLAETFMRGLMETTARVRPGDIVVCMDADNSHAPGLMLRMIREIQEGRDVVIASRYREGSVVRGVPWSRRVLSRGMSILFRIVFPIPGVRDYSCGYRAYRAEFLKTALAVRPEKRFSSDGFACMVGILLFLSREEAVIGEVPLVLRYDQKIGESKMKVTRTIRSSLSVLFRERFGAH